MALDNCSILPESEILNNESREEGHHGIPNQNGMASSDRYYIGGLYPFGYKLPVTIIIASQSSCFTVRLMFHSCPLPPPVIRATASS